MEKLIRSALTANIFTPMYSVLLLLYVLSPLALGLWLGAIPALLLIPLLTHRALDEEETLACDLKGYKEYMRKTKYRFFPGIW